MDFIERIFGVAPDGGSGLLEALWFLVPIAAIMAAIHWRKRHPRR
jgi:hypothetical protein